MTFWISNALCINFYNGHGKDTPELCQHFQMCQLNFAIFCAVSALIISQHLNHPSMLVHSVYRFQVCFDTLITLHHLVISLPNEDIFNKAEISCI